MKTRLVSDYPNAVVDKCKMPSAVPGSFYDVNVYFVKGDATTYEARLVGNAATTTVDTQ